jgi:septum formation protein
LGKPRDAEEAEFMLNLLSNKLQYIITGITLLDISKNRRETGVEVSKAKLKKLSSAEIKGYINSKEYEGKAGGICIQGKGAIFVEYIEGCYYNIVGLPLFKFYQLLQKLDYSLF